LNKIVTSWKVDAIFFTNDRIAVAQNKDVKYSVAELLIKKVVGCTDVHMLLDVINVVWNKKSLRIVFPT